MPRSRGGALLAAGLLAGAGAGPRAGAAQDSPAVQIDFYRALQGSSIDQHTTQSDDLASLGGVLKYIHTEIIPESLEAQTRWERKYSVDAIMKRRFKVKNPLNFDPSQVSFVDFGPFVTFDQGQSTNPGLDRLYETSGDFVGVQDDNNPGLALSKQAPNFWYSVSGFCPNSPWSQLPMPAGQTTARCSGPEKLCEAKGTPDSPGSQCIKYAGSTDVVAGGLCDGGADLNSTVPEVEPNGTHGCVYTYGKATLIKLDTLVGIGEQKCNGGQPCADWLDFRRNCDDPSLKKMFNANGEIIDAKNVSDHRPYCVEYDIHPACNLDCSSEACQNATTKEIGLPFWLGRCDIEANEQRVALLADAVGIEGALDKHKTVAQDVLDNDAPCIKPGVPSMCQPTFDATGSKGGPYCSRNFAGLCYLCHIPGTKTVYSPDADTKPVCPYDVLGKVDYKSMNKPNCKSSKPSDVCCFYTGTCEGSDDPSAATLDVEGLRLVEHRCWKEGSTEPMVKFAERIAKEKLGGELDPKSTDVQKFAYHQWGVSPGEQHFAAFLAGVQKHLGPAPTTPSPSPAPAPSSGGSSTAIIVILVIVGVVALALLGAFCYRRAQAARQPGLLADRREIASA